LNLNVAVARDSLWQDWSGEIFLRHVLLISTPERKFLSVCTIL
jgi:hypothetical protein